MSGKGYLTCIVIQKSITKSLTTIEKKTTKTGKNQKFSRKVRRKCRSHLTNKLFSEKFSCDPLNIFFKPMGAINVWIMWYEFKSNQ